jgi:putative Mn2+ efflux pump MntP
MNFLEIFLISCGLAFDAFAVSVSAGTLKSCESPRAAFRLSFHFGLFQFLMPVIGWFIGYQISEYVTFIDHWIAFGLLFLIGAKMIKETFEKSEEKKNFNPSKGSQLILLSIATSIDALAVGLSLAFLNVDIFIPSLSIGIITASLSFIGIKIGRKFGKKYSKQAEFIGGLILIGIGIKILFEHLTV